MGKTLAKTYKHELKKEHKVSPRKQSRKQSQKKPKKRISFAGGRDFGALAATTKLQPALLVLAALVLAVLFFVPLSGWMRPVTFAIPLLLASVQILPETASKLREGSFLNNALVTVLTAILLFALQFYLEAVLLLLLYALGGITPDRIPELRAAGAAGAMLMSWWIRA